MSALEEIAVERGRRSGALMTVAVDSTVLGPALGGVRLWRYDREADAVADATRLAAAMTHKAAAAGLDLGGGKGVIAAPHEQRPEGYERRAILLDFGDLVESLEGRYVTAEDVGTGADDMAVIAERSSHVVGLDSSRGGSGDPSPVTAFGVRAAMRACAEHRWGSGDLENRRVAIIGFGHVGSHLAELLRADRARLTIADVDPALRAPAEALGAEWVEPADALASDCDVLAPCALGGLIDERSVERLGAAVLCGAANNVLADEAVAERLLAREILYAPDFIANVGGLISVYGELRGEEHAVALERVAGIEETIASILADAERRGVTPLAAARDLSEARLRRGCAGARAGGSRRPAGINLRHS
jgi:leucine dehydrogenase